MTCSWIRETDRRLALGGSDGKPENELNGDDNGRYS